MALENTWESWQRPRSCFVLLHVPDYCQCAYNLQEPQPVWRQQVCFHISSKDFQVCKDCTLLFFPIRLKDFGTYRHKIRKNPSFLIRKESIREITTGLVTGVWRTPGWRGSKEAEFGTPLTCVYWMLFPGWIYHGFRTGIPQRPRKETLHHKTTLSHRLITSSYASESWLTDPACSATAIVLRRMDDVGQSTPGIHKDVGLKPTIICK